MHRITRFALFAAIAIGQSAFGRPAFAQSADPFKPKPPAEVDQALRARIQEFYDLHVKAQYRKAEELVAEDTKDYFYTHDKPKYISCETTSVDYTDHFTKATASVTCDRYVIMPGFMDKPLKVPGKSTWKLVDGKWYWYVNQDPVMDGPFKMHAGAFPNAGAAAPPSLANIPTTGDFLMAQVKMEPREVKLKPGETAEVTITNGAPGPLDLVVSGNLAGVEAKLDRSKLKSGEAASLTVRAAKGAKSGVLTVEVEPTTQKLPLQVTIVE